MHRPPTTQNGYAIRALRQLRGVSTRDLADALDVTQPTVRNWENEWRGCDTVTLTRIAHVLDVDPRALSRARAAS